MNHGRLAPVSEHANNTEEQCSKKSQPWRQWLSTHFPHKKCDLRILLSVLGCPLFPVSVDPKHALTQVSSSPQYIIQHFSAATGCRNMEVKNMYATGKVTMAREKGCFVMWQMGTHKWLIELVVGGHKVVAGCDAKVAWRHTPWLGCHVKR